MKQIQIFLLTFCVSILAGCGSDNAAGGPAASASSTASQSASADTAGQVHPGEEIYNNYCFSCHTPGLSGAPKLGDADGWAPRIAKGRDLLVQATIEGIQPAMPPRGMCFNCSDEDIEVVVDYMIEKSQ